MMTDTITTIAAALGSGGLGAVVARYAVPAVASWLRHREKGRAQVAVSTVEERIAKERGAVAVVEDLRELLREAREERRQEREADRKACDEHVRRELEHAEARCQEHTREAVESATVRLRTELITTNAQLADLREQVTGREDTGVVLLRDTDRRLSTPVPPED